MNGTNLFKIALRALSNNKLRAFLTMLGIIIGVASVITMLAIGQGSKKSIQAQISEMGSNMIMIHPGADMRGGVRQDPSAMQTLKLTDYESLRNETNFLSAVSPNVSSSGQLIAGNNNYPSSVSGVGTDYLEIRQLTIDNGEMFTEADIQTSAKVCVIGKTIQDNLFPGGEDPVGRIIRFNQVPFRVVGVLKSKGYNSMGMDQDDVVLAPYSTVMKRLLAQTYLSGIFASALSEDMTDNATEEITEILRRNHHEHHVRQCHGTYTRNRAAHVRRRPWSRYPEPVSDRSYPHQHHRRSDRRRHRLRCQLDSKECSPLAHLHPALECIPLLRRMYRHRGILWLVSCQESSGPGSD